MKIVFQKQDLIENLVPVLGTITTKNTITSLEGVLIETIGGNTVRFSTYDMNKGTRNTFEAVEVIEEGSYIINAQKLLQVVRVLDDGEITIDVDSKHTVHISSGSSTFTLYALKGTDFPSLPELISDEGFEIPADTLKNMIVRVSHSISDNDSHPNLKGVFLSIKENVLKVVSCDSYTLSECTASCDVNQIGKEEVVDYSFILPGHSINELVKILSDKKETVSIYLARKHAIFRMNGIIFFTRLIDGEYFDYKKIIPTDQTIFVEISKESFLNSLERAVLVAEEKMQTQDKSFVTLDIQGDKLSMYSTSSSGRVYDEISVKHTGDDLKIGFNCRYLMNSVRIANTDTLLLGFKAYNQVVTIKALNEDDSDKFFYMILPVRIPDNL